MFYVYKMIKKVYVEWMNENHNPNFTKFGIKSNDLTSLKGIFVNHTLYILQFHIAFVLYYPHNHLQLLAPTFSFSQTHEELQN